MQGWKKQDRKMMDKNAKLEDVGRKCRAGIWRTGNAC